MQLKLNAYSCNVIIPLYGPRFVSYIFETLLEQPVDDVYTSSLLFFIGHAKIQQKLQIIRMMWTLWIWHFTTKMAIVISS